MTLDDAILGAAIERLRAVEPEAIGVLLTGSYAKGTATRGSDLDLMALTRDAPRVDYRMWFDGDLHISAGATSVAAWRASGEQPARWALGFPARNAARYLWGADACASVLGADPSLQHPAASPELEDFVDFAVKAAKYFGAGDTVGGRWMAQSAAQLAPTLLIPLNEERIVHDRRDALDAALSFSVAPQRYSMDAAVCLGVRASCDADAQAANRRLARNMLAFLRVRRPDVDPQPELSCYLADGTLERCLGIVD